MIITETDTAVSDYLRSIGVEYTAMHKGLERDETGWVHDEWRVEFKRAGKAKPLCSKFRTGYGYRSTKSMEVMPLFYDLKNCEAWLKSKGAKPVAPPAASVINSLFMDGEADIVSFDSWCMEMGMDSDSIKALNMYQECARIGREVRAFFSREESEALREMLFDY